MRSDLVKIYLVEPGQSRDYGHAFFTALSGHLTLKAAAIISEVADRFEVDSEVDRVQLVLAALFQAAIETSKDPYIPVPCVQVDAALLQEIARLRGVE